MQQSVRVLYVDDDRDIRTIVGIALEGHADIVLDTAGSGAEAMEKAPGFAPQMILLDVMMPGMDGPATFAQLRALAGFEQVPVAFVTAKAQPSEITELMQMGAAAVISKPFNPLRLAAQIRDIWRDAQHE